ncbi:heterokaryon incompatibility protein-domain-containing protein [Dendryphion nanum]|uniref:Heterokaryon incompatibility protein-domain-containing protein n=1 Tax=Dendryphion nanum TaxID=256645 RepID=A0A9P9DYJ7_9PLEO|nr:heterokaryon incompatibility protein-domain-containing protein [Dendryphion nanum]
MEDLFSDLTLDELVYGVFDPKRDCSICEVIKREKDLVNTLEDIATASRDYRGCGACNNLQSGVQKYLDQCAQKDQPDVDWKTIKFHMVYPEHQGRSRYMLPVLEILQIAKLNQFDPQQVNSHQSPDSTQRLWFRRNVPTSLELSALVAQISSWTSMCKDSHPICQNEDSPRLPKRVLDIGADDIDGIRLSQPQNISAPYICLSYCWGIAAGTITTTQENVDDHLRHIPWNNLPILFQDAIRICRALKIRYLWIDALCIIQNSTADWEIESARMASIYSQSFLTIAASSCPNPKTGLFGDRWTNFESRVPRAPKPRFPIGTITTESDGYFVHVRPQLHLAHERFQDSASASEHKIDAPLLTRAWVLQERLLPSRIIHIHSEELVWECKSGLRCECGVLDELHLSKNRVPRTHSELWLKSSLADAELSQDLNKLSGVWTKLVAEFSALHITYDSDRLPALSGLAAQLDGPVLGKYFAGVWTQCIAPCLLWEIVNIPRKFPKRPLYQPNAPSWSWASVPLSKSQIISYKSVDFFRDINSEFKVINLEGRTLGNNPYGWVQDASLEVQGLCVRTEIHHKDYRGIHLWIPSHPSFVSFTMMRSDRSTRKTGFLLLYVGLRYCLVLSKLPGPGRQYRREGFTELPNNHLNSWVDKMELKKIVIV